MMQVGRGTAPCRSPALICNSMCYTLTHLDMSLTMNRSARASQSLRSLEAQLKATRLNTYLTVQSPAIVQQRI